MPKKCIFRLSPFSFVYDYDNTIIATADISPIGPLYVLKDAGSTGWFLKTSTGGIWQIWHMDSSGAMRTVFKNDVDISGSFTGLSNGDIAIQTPETGIITLYDAAGSLRVSKDVW